MTYFCSFYYLISLCPELSNKVLVLPIQASQLRVTTFFQSLRGDYGLLAFSILPALVCNLLVKSLQTKQVNCSHQNNPFDVYNIPVSDI